MNRDARQPDETANNIDPGHADLANTDSSAQEASQPVEDHALNRAVIFFLVLFLLAVLFIPSDWLIRWSMWLNATAGP